MRTKSVRQEVAESTGKRQVTAYVSPSTGGVLDNLRDRGLNQCTAVAAILDWFGKQQPTVQAVILGLIPQEAVPQFGELCEGVDINRQET